jgi:geranylgeranyl diphosphate/geranylgeranyl-bacteriochlorophyllide a reductase
MQQTDQNPDTVWDAIVVGGGPAGATAAHQLAIKGFDVLLIERGGKIKPCGGAVPPRLIRDYQIPDHLIVDKALAARMVSPSQKKVDMAIDGGYVGMVDREQFDEWLRLRAVGAGAVRRTAKFKQYTSLPGGVAQVTCETGSETIQFKTRCVIGADGANSRVAAQAVRGSDRGKFVFAYHEIVKVAQGQNQRFEHANGSVGARCDVIYDARVSPDFYGWVFPHGNTMSIGTGSADKGYSLKSATARLRDLTGLAHLETIRCEGAPIPLKPLPHWDDGKHVILAGDAAGVVAPASGEGIYYAMYGGELAANAAGQFLRTNDVRCLAQARKQFMKEHRKVFWVLGIMQWFWYSSDKRREHFVEICKDADVQKLTFDSYMNKKLVRKKPLAHVRIFFKDLAHLLGFARA